AAGAHLWARLLRGPPRRVRLSRARARCRRSARRAAARRRDGGRVKIGIVCYPSFGGSGVVAAELARGFAERGHRVHVIATAPPSRALPFSDNLQFHEVRIPDYPVFEHRPYEHALTATLVEVASAERLDVLLVHYAVPHATSALLARQVLGAD